jgi:hypothetical protein
MVQSVIRARNLADVHTFVGGHYGPAFVTFFDEQNQNIERGKVKGEKITTSALMINKCASTSSFA